MSKTKKDILHFLKKGKFYRYLGETMPRAYHKEKIYRCYFLLPYMAGMSRLGKGIKSPTISFVYNYPCNFVKNWKRVKVKTWQEVRKLENESKL